MPDAYIPIDELSPVDSDTVPSGTLVYLPYGNSYALFGIDQDKSRLLFDLGGERPLLIWTIKDGGLGHAIALKDWRIEVDPASACKVENRLLPFGYAFIGPDGYGIVGRRATGREQAMPIYQDGTVYTGGSNPLRGAFHVWRIVCGSAEHPVILIESSTFSIETAS